MSKRGSVTRTTTTTTTTTVEEIVTTTAIDPKRIEAALRLVNGIPTDVLEEFPTWLLTGAMRHLYAPGDARVKDWEIRIRAFAEETTKKDEKAAPQRPNRPPSK